MRLIDADVLEIMFKRIGLSPVTKRIVDAAPTVYAVEVVRCKDCKHIRQKARIRNEEKMGQSDSK